MRLELLAAVATLLAEATASTVTLPLRSRAKEHEARGDGKFRLPDSRRYLNASSGVNVPVIDWFNRTDNQVSIEVSGLFVCVQVADDITSGTPPLALGPRHRLCESNSLLRCTGRPFPDFI